MTTLGRRIIQRCEADYGRYTYTQDSRREAMATSLAGDCSSYVRMVLRDVAGIDPGGWTGAIAIDGDGRDITTSKTVILAGDRLQDGDVVLLGWSSDHRPGYAFSHVAFYDAAKRVFWDQYGDVPPHNGPRSHGLAQWIDRCDRVLVRRFLPDEPVGTPTSGLAATVITNPPTSPGPVASGVVKPILAVDGIFGPGTRRRLQQYLGVPQTGIWDDATIRKLQRFLNVTVDGIFGPISTRALQRLVGTTADGEWGPLTTKALQRWLNGQR